ncbi:ferric enterobactin ABC transporter, permease protein FepG [Mycolicibacterium canariasense]|uniref:Ferric enterobactin ABC transporter, permease protein FepG n=1 Tax=Mycolicibacterium canariasense TaxID=228230 RepID=A0A117I9K5_MYCCR|nr:iron chelate uptake ABC transporter family permease subunit [Mycolicibacterium canariasense]MCV7209482.1 iron chelate uptake ABC transporter family permease subunit [Mycolicibacterium canariasense]ORV05721.1 iron ABC transporter permease [Mycolicibacterium canariasense]GAS94982.1 ferric enterobactin ABC transporter, permease protein FepG [Mycolicibacterium canariasense]
MSGLDPVDFGRRQLVLRREPALSLRASWRSVTVLSGLGFGALILAVLALGVGEYPVSPAEVIDVLTGREQGFVSVLVLQWRMPRIVLALVIGAALGMSGAIFQALTRNPLGSPDVIGFNFGAYTGALVAIGAFGGGYYLTALGGVIGGLLTAVVVYLLAYRQGVAGFRLIIVGIGVGAMLSSLNQWIILKIKLHQAITAAIWQQGTLSGLHWEQAIPVLVCVAIVIAILVPIGPQLPILQMGDDAAGGLGVRPERARVAYFGVGVLLIAVATAAAGPISFVALAAPQLARRVAGTPGVGLVSSAVMGAFLLLSSDLLALRIFAPAELPVGAVTVVAGGVYLIWLLVVQARKGQ